MLWLLLKKSLRLNMTDLLGCPFCGSNFLFGKEPYDNEPVGGLYYVFHEYGPIGSAARECPISVSSYFGTKEEAALAWNTRAAARAPSPSSAETIYRCAKVAYDTDTLGLTALQTRQSVVDRIRALATIPPATPAPADEQKDAEFWRKLLDRQNLLIAHHPRCRACNSDQVQLIRHIPPAEWKCRRCKLIFTSEPPAVGPADDRKTFPIPEGHEAVLDADGRATGETRPADAEPVAWRWRHVNDAACEWHYTEISTKIARRHNEYIQAEPLYARPAPSVMTEEEVARIIERIAASNYADPTTDDLTVPLAIELAECQAALAKLRAERGET
jgi:hypothetical protein